MSFFEELKRRNVFKVGLAYFVASWLVLQITDVLMSVLGLPDSAGKFVFLLLVIGFIPVLVFSWAYEVTPEGIKRESEVDRDESLTRETASRLNRTTIVLLIAVAVMVVVDRFVPKGETEKGSGSITTESGVPAADSAEVIEPDPISAPPTDGRQSVAVLPFVNMSDDAQNEYFSDGISEELLNVLVKIKNLRVPSRTSSFTFKGSKQSMAEIGQALDVDHVLEGSVRKAGDRIRVTAQLIDVRTDTHLWSDTYTRELHDIFAVQDEISQAIVQALQVTLSGADQEQLSSRPTDNVEAYNQYLLGRHWWNQRIPGRMAEALPPLRKAVELDPGFDQAWAALADVYVLLPEYGEGTVAVNIPLALDATKQALAINPDSARALTTSAYIKAMHQYRWQEAEQEFLRAIVLEPGYVTAHQWYAEMLAVERRIDEALAQLDVASEIDPLAPIIPHIKGWICVWDGRLQEAEQHYLTGLRLDPRFPYAISNLALVYMQTGEYDKARARWQEFAQLQENKDRVKPYLLTVDAVEDPALRDQALAALQAPGVPIDPFNAPLAFAMLDRYDLALDALLRNFESGGPYVVHVNRMKIFDPLRDDPRFQEMLRKMNLLDEGEVTR